jgi:hypothetical protein
MNQEIIRELTERKDIIHLYDWMKLDETLTNLDKRTLQFQNPFSHGSPHSPNKVDFPLLGLDYNSVIIDTICKEINEDFPRLILKSLFNTDKFDFIDRRSKTYLEDDYQSLLDLAEMIIQSGYKNVVTTAKIASHLRDINYFLPDPSTVMYKTTLYRVGSLRGVNIWVHAYMRYDDDMICLFDSVSVNIGKIESFEHIEPIGISYRHKVSYSCDFRVDDSKLILLIQNENSEAYKKYKTLIRDKKIDNILNTQGGTYTNHP